MKNVLRFGVGVALALSLVGAVRAQEEDDYDTTPSKPIERTWFTAMQGNPETMFAQSFGGQPRAVIDVPRKGDGPWRFMVTCDETTMEQPDVTGEQNGRRRIVHAVLLVERPAGSSDYSFTLEQMSMDEVRGDLADMLALPQTDPLKPVPSRDGSPLYTRTLPTVIGTKAVFAVRNQGWITRMRFSMGETAEMDATIGVLMIARFLTNVCLPMHKDEVGKGAAWTFKSDEELDGVPFRLHRRVELLAMPEGGKGISVSQSFVGTVEKPKKAPNMFADLKGEPRTFGSALTGGGTTTWGTECPVPISATLVWTEDCNGTFVTEEADGSPSREVAGESAARWNSEMHFIEESPKLFVEAGVMEEVTTPEVAPDGGAAEGEEQVAAFDPQAEFATLPMDLDKAGEQLEKVLKDARATPLKAEAGVEPKRSWLWKQGEDGQAVEQRVEVRVHSQSRESDVIGVPIGGETIDATATLLLALSGKKDEDGFLTGTVKIEELTYAARMTDAAGVVMEETITDEELEELAKRTIPLTIGDTGRAWVSRLSMDVLNPAVVRKAFTVVDALCETAVERTMSDMGVGAGAAESLGDMAAGKDTARARVTFDQSGAEGPLHLKDVDLWFMKDHMKFKMWGEPTEATHSERISLTVRHNVDGDGLVMSNTMVMGELERMRATYVKDGKELEGERVGLEERNKGL